MRDGVRPRLGAGLRRLFTCPSAVLRSVPATRTTRAASHVEAMHDGCRLPPRRRDVHDQDQRNGNRRRVPQRRSRASSCLAPATWPSRRPFRPSAPSGTFDVHRPLAGERPGIVRATDNLGATCTVGVSFRTRAAGPVANEEICPQLEGYSLKRVSGVAIVAARRRHRSALPVLRPAPAATSCPEASSFRTPLRRAACSSIRSPIAGDVAMAITKHTGSFESSLRMFISRSTDLGVTYGAFATVADQTRRSRDRRRIRGTGQWSDIRVTTGSAMSSSPGVVSLVPAWADWAKVVVLLLMLTSIIAFAWRQATKGDRTSRHP